MTKTPCGCIVEAEFGTCQHNQGLILIDVQPDFIITREDRTERPTVELPTLRDSRIMVFGIAEVIPMPETSRALQEMGIVSVIINDYAS